MSIIKRVLSRYVKICIVILAVILASACEPASILPDPVAGDFADDPSSGAVTFTSSSEDDYSTAFWYPAADSYQNRFNILSVSVQKDSGYAQADYGILFCYQDDNNYYLLTIDTLGNYNVKKRVDGNYTTLIDWTASANLNTGYSVENLLAVQQTTPSTFDISFNSVQSDTFSDDSFTAGSSGYFVYVSDGDHESFPFEPESVTFKIIP